MRKQGWHKLEIIILLVGLSLLAGCKTKASASAVLIPTGQHILLPAPGDIVPPLPTGEERWWLLTPTGIAFLLPSDAPILNTSTNAP